VFNIYFIITLNYFLPSF